MDHDCSDFEKITNPGLKRLYSIRCNRFLPDSSKPKISEKNYKTNVYNYNIVIFLFFMLIFIIIVNRNIKMIL